MEMTDLFIEVDYVNGKGLMSLFSGEFMDLLAFEILNIHFATVR